MRDGFRPCTRPFVTSKWRPAPYASATPMFCKATTPARLWDWIIGEPMFPSLKLSWSSAFFLAVQRPAQLISYSSHAAIIIASVPLPRGYPESCTAQNPKLGLRAGNACSVGAKTLTLCWHMKSSRNQWRLIELFRRGPIVASQPKRLVGSGDKGGKRKFAARFTKVS